MTFPKIMIEFPFDKARYLFPLKLAYVETNSERPEEVNRLRLTMSLRHAQELRILMLQVSITRRRD